MAKDGTEQFKFDGREIFRSLYLHMVEGVALHELVCDEAGNPTDYRILDVNPQFDAYVGVAAFEAIGKLATEVYGTPEPPYLAEFARAVFSGTPTRFETHFAPFDRFYDISVVPFGTRQFATVFLDISERRRSERALRESEWYLQRAQHVAHIGSYRFDIAKGTWRSSQALNVLFGIEDDFHRDLAGWLSLVHPEDREDMHRYLIEDVVLAGRDFDRRYRLVRANDGSVRWVHGMGELEKDASGQPIVMVGIIQDVTESTLKEQALRESEERFRRIFELIPGPVTLAQTDGTIIACNDGFCAAMGYPREELLGKSTRELSTWVDPHQRDAMYAEVAQGKSVDWLEFKMRRRDGLVRTMQIFARPFELAGKAMVLSVGRDITDQRNLEQQMLHSQKLESLGVLAGGIAHDFNNLLTGILGNADLAKTEMSPLAPSRASLEGIEVAARRAADLCRQLLAYSGRGRFIIEPLDLCELVQEMGHLLTVSISKKAVLKYHFSQGIPAVEADATQLRQVIMNLIVNASEAVGERSGVISITVGLAHCEADYLKGCFGTDRLQPGDYVYLEVADTGHGMDKSTMDRIFDPFFSTKFTGRGLGLAAVLGIMRGHHGAIKVYSEPGRGTTFKLLFPASESSVSTQQTTTYKSAGYHASGKILLADDEETIRNLGRRMLQRAGFEVILAADGREAIDKFVSDKDSISLVILDLTMPHADGETCYREMRQLKPGVRVILSSGYNEQDIVNRFAGKGLAGFIQKPYTTEELLDKIREALEKT
jgi:two-component system cell cycle sensor histidine kinase/response regulator CckA